MIFIDSFDRVRTRTKEHLIYSRYGIEFYTKGPLFVGSNLHPHRVRPPLTIKIRTEVWWVLTELVSIEEYQTTKSFNRLKYFCTETISDECGNTREIKSNFERLKLVGEFTKLIDSRLELVRHKIKLLFRF